MILAYSSLAIIVVALLLGRDLTKLGTLKFRAGSLLLGGILILFSVQVGVILSPSGNSAGQTIILLATNVALIAIFLYNRHIPGFYAVALGILLNVLVMAANGGLMPITPETYRAIRPNRAVATYERPPSSKNIILPRTETTLWFLSDAIPLVLPGKRSAVSLGDIVLLFGVGQCIFQVTAPKNKAACQSSV